MKTKTFISQSSHKDFFEIVDNFLSNADSEEKNTLIKELSDQKEKLENTFVQYKGKFDELHRLIAEYQEQQKEIRKKIRQIQLVKKDKKTAGSGYFKKGLQLGGSFQWVIYLLINSCYIDDIWDSFADMLEAIA